MQLGQNQLKRCQQQYADLTNFFLNHNTLRADFSPPLSGVVPVEKVQKTTTTSVFSLTLFGKRIEVKEISEAIFIRT